MSAFTTRDPVLRLRIALVLLPALLLGGTVGYRLIEGMTWFQGFYMTLITVSTVGFGEIGELSQAGRAFTACLILAGVFLVAFSTAAFIESIVEGELAHYFGRRRLEREIAALQGHWIICGYGRMGALVAKEIRRSKNPPPFVVMDQNLERIKHCEEDGNLYLMADATDEESLRMAGIERARGLVSLVASDAGNVFICLTARQMNPKLLIIARALEDRSTPKLRHAGANKVISPYQVGGHRLSQAVLQPAVADFLEFAQSHDLLLEMEEARILEQSRLAGVDLRNANLRIELDLIVLAIRRPTGEMLFNPRADTRLQAGDTLIAMGSAAHLAELQKIAAGR